MPKKLDIPEIQPGKDNRTLAAKWIAKAKGAMSNAENDLDKAGVERKQLDEEGIATLRTDLGELLPGTDEETIDAVIQAVADAVIMPEEVEEEIVETAMDDEEEKSDEVVELAKVVTAVAKDYNGVYEDMRTVLEMVETTVKSIQTQTKDYNDLRDQVTKLQKQYAGKPRRASQSPETEVDSESVIAKQMAARNLDGVPDNFKDMFEGVQ